MIPCLTVEGVQSRTFKATLDDFLSRSWLATATCESAKDGQVLLNQRGLLPNYCMFSIRLRMTQDLNKCFCVPPRLRLMACSGRASSDALRRDFQQSDGCGIEAVFHWAGCFALTLEPFPESRIGCLPSSAGHPQRVAGQFPGAGAGCGGGASCPPCDSPTQPFDADRSPWS